MSPEETMAAAFSDEMEKIAISAAYFRLAKAKRLASIAGESSSNLRKMRIHRTRSQLERMGSLASDNADRRFEKSEDLIRRAGVSRLEAHNRVPSRRLTRQAAKGLDSVASSTKLDHAIRFPAGRSLEERTARVLRGVPKPKSGFLKKPRVVPFRSVRAVSPPAKSDQALPYSMAAK